MPPITHNAKINHLFWLTLFVLFCAAVYTLRSVLMPFVAGLIIGYLLDPVASRFEKMGLSRGLATTVVMLIAILVTVPTIILIVNMVNDQLTAFIIAIPRYVSALIKRLEPLFIELQNKFPDFNAESIKDYIRSNLSEKLRLAGRVAKGVASGSAAIISTISLLLITPIVAFYMLRDWKKFIAKIDGLLPRKVKPAIEVQAREIDRTLAAFIRGQLSVCLILGTFYAVTLYFFVGLELGLLVGFIAGIFSFITYVGTIVGLIISLILGFAQFSSLSPLLSIAIVFAIGQTLDGYFLTPKLIGDSVGLHPVWIMFALLAGGVLLGFLGLLLAVPLAAIIGVITRHAIANYKKSSIYLED